MKINILNAVIILAVILTVTTACESDESATPNNPLNGKTTAVFNPNKSYGSMSDIDGNIYKTIKIGEQIWMAENLRATRYQNGDSIPNITDNNEWGNLSTGAYCNYNNTSNLDTIATYGRLYNFYAVDDSRQIAPEGWRVPHIEDWLILIEYLGGDQIASNHLKEVGNTHWIDPYQSDNSSGFTAIPNGDRYLTKEFTDIGFFSVLWTASKYNNEKAGFLYLYDFSSDVSKGINYKANGYAIRLIKDKY